MLRSNRYRGSSDASRVSQGGQRSTVYRGLSGQRPIAAATIKSLDLALKSDADFASTEEGLCPDSDMDKLTSTMSALRFVPPSVRFGRGGHRGGLSQ